MCSVILYCPSKIFACMHSAGGILWKVTYSFSTCYSAFNLVFFFELILLFFFLFLYTFVNIIINKNRIHNVTVYYAVTFCFAREDAGRKKKISVFVARWPCYFFIRDFANTISRKYTNKMRLDNKTFFRVKAGH